MPRTEADYYMDELEPRSRAALPAPAVSPGSASSAGAVDSSGSSGLLVTAQFSRRRIAVIFAGLVCLWMVGVFARQVGEAATAADQAEMTRARNAAVERDIEALQAELKLIQQPAFVNSTARGYLLGTSREIPFTIDQHAPPLPSNAPGSAGVKPAPTPPAGSPLDAWLNTLFGSQ